MKGQRTIDNDWDSFTLVCLAILIFSRRVWMHLGKAMTIVSWHGYHALQQRQMHDLIYIFWRDHLATRIFYYFSNKQKLSAGIDPGMALTPSLISLWNEIQTHNRRNETYNKYYYCWVLQKYKMFLFWVSFIWYYRLFRMTVVYERAKWMNLCSNFPLW